MTYRAFTVDRRFNDWHYTLPPDWSYIDLDGVVACQRCKEPLALYEITSSSEFKPTTIMQNLARRAGILCYLIRVPSGEDVGKLTAADQCVWHRLGGGSYPHVGTLAEFACEENRLRGEHDCAEVT